MVVKGNEWDREKVQARGAPEAGPQSCYLEACLPPRGPHVPQSHTPQSPGPGAPAGEGLGTCKEGDQLFSTDTASQQRTGQGSGMRWLRFPTEAAIIPGLMPSQETVS